MERTTLGLIAALGVVAPLGGALASQAPDEAQRALHASTVAELLDPIPNAVAVMNATETERAQGEQQQRLAQIVEFGHHHHHHHHHRWFRHHHHHHHHHHWRWHRHHHDD